MRIKNSFISLVSLLALASCEKNVTIDIPQKAPRLVVNGIIAKGDWVSVSIGKTRHILDPAGSNPANSLVTNASVIVLQDGMPFDTLAYEPSLQVYRSPVYSSLQDGHSYTLKAEAPGFTAVEAQTFMPSQSVIAEVTRVRHARIDSYGDQQDEIRIRFNDPAEKNFYQVQVMSSYFGSNGYPVSCVQTTDKDVEAIGYNDPMANDDCLDGGSILMRDNNFSGGQKTLILYVSSNSLMEYPDGSGNMHRPFIRLNRITEDQFRYIKTFALYDNAVDNPFAEPVNVYTNVKNGYGIFAGYTQAVDTLR